MCVCSVFFFLFVCPCTGELACYTVWPPPPTCAAKLCTLQIRGIFFYFFNIFCEKNHLLVRRMVKVERYKIAIFSSIMIYDRQIVRNHWDKKLRTAPTYLSRPCVKKQSMVTLDDQLHAHIQMQVMTIWNHDWYCIFQVHLLAQPVVFWCFDCGFCSERSNEVLI